MPNYPQNRVFFNRQLRRAFKPDSVVSLNFYNGTLNLGLVNQRAAGVDNPRWKEQVVRHQNAGTVLSGSRFSIDGETRGRLFFALEANRPSVSPQRLTWEVLGDLITNQQITLTSPYVSSFNRDLALELAQQLFYDKAWKTIRSFEGGIFLGELREALSMIRTPAKAIRQGIDSFAASARKRAKKASTSNGRHNPRNSRSVGKTLSETWLEYVFGWRPLISDIESGAKAIERLSRKPEEFKRFSVRAGAEDDLITDALAAPQSVLFINQMRYWFSTAIYIGQVSVWIQAEARVSVDSPLTFSKDVLGFTWESFAPTVWELIPYSFLVDYFSNIGDVISAWSFPRGRITWHNRSIVNRAEKRLLMIKRPTPNPSPSDYKIVSDSGPSFMVKTERSSFTRDQLEIDRPSFIFHNGQGLGLRWLNIAALAGSRFL